MVFEFQATCPAWRVLVVEDDTLVRLVTVEVIAALGFDVVETEDAAAALELLERGVVPDLLLTDVRMPGAIDGFGLAQIVARRWPQIGILVCSAHAQPEDADLPRGSVFLRKPYLPAALARELAGLAGRVAVPTDA
jgi:two-component system, response regulator PdtaR